VPFCAWTALFPAQTSRGGAPRFAFGSWILADGKTINRLTTGQCNEIILSEDDELLGIRFRHADRAIPGFEASVFVKASVWTTRVLESSANQQTYPVIPSSSRFGY